MKLYGTYDWTATPLVQRNKLYQRLKAQALRDAGKIRPSRADDPLTRKLIEIVPLAIKLTHPDKHGNSPASNEVTQLLLALRKQTKGR